MMLPLSDLHSRHRHSPCWGSFSDTTRRRWTGGTFCGPRLARKPSRTFARFHGIPPYKTKHISIKSSSASRWFWSKMSLGHFRNPWDLRTRLVEGPWKAPFQLKKIIQGSKTETRGLLVEGVIDSGKSMTLHIFDNTVLIGYSDWPPSRGLRSL